MNEERISTFLLERYHIGEVTHEEKTQVDVALARDKALAAALADLDCADKDFFQRFPIEKVFPEKVFSIEQNVQRRPPRRIKKIPRPVWSICAAALIVLITLPFFILRNPAENEYSYRTKGASAGNSSIELSIYLKGNSPGEVIRLIDQAGISEGNTIQLTYRVFAANTDAQYGVIFSIDGRSYVTMHYPYAPWQSTLLVSGSTVPLDTAFILDDAPDYEIFFFVAGDKPMDVREILTTARQLAVQIEGNPQEALRRGNAAFRDYELAIFTLLKQE